jgi:hypothetical protein
MKISNAVTIALLVAAEAGQTKPTTPLAPKVIICLEYGNDLSVTYRAQIMASRMFAGIDVATEWHGDHSCPARRDIVIRLRGDTPFDYRPGALAEAYPYEGTHIRVFYDRVQQSVHPRVVPYLLAHVLVHEITHILEGINRHSESGVMKALWDEQDHVAMVSKPLPFASEDVRLIHAGIERRYASLPAPDSVPPASSAPALCAISWNARAREHPGQVWYRVNVQIRSQVEAPLGLLQDSQQAATTIFAGIHVQLIWSSQLQPASNAVAGRPGELATRDLAVEVVPHAPASFSDVALAMALPYSDSGVRIVIFYDRLCFEGTTLLRRPYWATCWPTKSHTFYRGSRAIPRQESCERAGLITTSNRWVSKCLCSLPRTFN